jgi:2-oxoglutarate ferredoxin oxidoreductase subunit gamma
VDRIELRITGFGGQGVVLAGYIIGKAASICGGREATMIQSFGPEARGSACSATVVIKDDRILYPYIRRPSILVALSAEGYEKYREELAPDGILLHESDLVRPRTLPEQRAYGVPSTRIAEGLGRAIVQNIVMLGFFTAATSLVTREQMREAVASSVPPGTEKLNLRAFEAGLTHFDETYGSRRRGTSAAPLASGVPGGASA